MALIQALLAMLSGCLMTQKQKEAALSHPSPILERRMDRVIGRFPGAEGNEDAVKQILFDTGFHATADERRKMLAEAK